MVPLVDKQYGSYYSAIGKLRNPIFELITLMTLTEGISAGFIEKIVYNRTPLRKNYDFQILLVS